MKITTKMNNTPNKFFSFLKTINFFSSELDARSERKNKLEQEVDILINEKNEKGVELFIEKGYLPNENQRIEILKNLYIQKS